MQNDIKSCRDCPFSESSSITNNLKNNYRNWFCLKDKCRKMIIDLSVKDSDNLIPPLWCPNKSNDSNSKYKLINSTENKKNENSMKPSRLYLTTFEKRNILEKIEPIVKWDDITVNKIYHVPPLLSEKRKDILIVSKSNYSCTYRILSNNPNNSSSGIYTLYKTTLMSRFLVPHKVQNIEIVNNTNK